MKMKFKAILPALVVATAGMSVPAWAAEDASLASLRAELAQQQALLAAQQQQLETLAGALEKQAGHTAEDSTHVGFYGEVHYNAFRETDPAQGKRNFHAHRAVILLSHAFADNLSFYSEVEFEGAADETEIETELEQLFIDWRLSPRASLNLGQFLLPVGLLNESHEPDVFYGVERNPVEERIIPATWWEKGAMLRLLPKNGIALDLAVHNGLRGDVATLGGAEGLREFRQEFGGARAENMAYTLRLKVQAAQGLELGVTAQWQEDINDASVVPERAPAVLLEAHADYRWRDMRFRSLYAQWSVDGAMAKAAGADLISGYYLEPSWKANDRVGLFARLSQWNTAATLAGKEDDRQVNIGFNYGLNPRVVLKADLQDSNQPGGLGDGLNLGVGLSF